MGIYDSGNAESENQPPIPNWIKYLRLVIWNIQLGILHPIGYILLLALYWNLYCNFICNSWWEGVEITERKLSLVDQYTKRQKKQKSAMATAKAKIKRGGPKNAISLFVDSNGKKIMVLLSASVERFGVSRVRDFFCWNSASCPNWQLIWLFLWIYNQFDSLSKFTVNFALSLNVLLSV